MKLLRPTAAKVDKDGNEIYWGECVICAERTHGKVKDVKDRVMVPGETYYFMHEHCSNRWKNMEKRERKSKSSRSGE